MALPGGDEDLRLKLAVNLDRARRELTMSDGKPSVDVIREIYIEHGAQHLFGDYQSWAATRVEGSRVSKITFRFQGADIQDALQFTIGNSGSRIDDHARDEIVNTFGVAWNSQPGAASKIVRYDGPGAGGRFRVAASIVMPVRNGNYFWPGLDVANAARLPDGTIPPDALDGVALVSAKSANDWETAVRVIGNDPHVRLALGAYINPYRDEDQIQAGRRRFIEMGGPVDISHPINEIAPIVDDFPWRMDRPYDLYAMRLTLEQGQSFGDRHEVIVTITYTPRRLIRPKPDPTLNLLPAMTMMPVDTLAQVIAHLNLEDLHRLCETHQADICKKHDLWEELIDIKGWRALASLPDFAGRSVREIYELIRSGIEDPVAECLGIEDAVTREGVMGSNDAKWRQRSYDVGEDTSLKYLITITADDTAIMPEMPNREYELNTLRSSAYIVSRPVLDIVYGIASSVTRKKPHASIGIQMGMVRINLHYS